MGIMRRGREEKVLILKYLTYKACKFLGCLGSDVGIPILQAIEYLSQPVRLIGLYHGSHVPVVQG